MEGQWLMARQIREVRNEGPMQRPCSGADLIALLPTGAIALLVRRCVLLEDR